MSRRNSRVRKARRRETNADRLSEIGLRAFSEYQQTRHSKALTEAVTAFRAAVAATPDSHAELAGRLSNLGGSLGRRFELTGDRADLEAAIDAGRRAVALTPVGHPILGPCLSNLGAFLRMRFTLTGDRADLDAAIDAGRQAIELIQPQDPDLAGRLANLMACLGTRFEHDGDPADLDAAIDTGQRIIAIAPPGDPQLAMPLSNLVPCLRSRFDLRGDPADLDAAIDLGRQAVAAGSPGDPRFAANLSNLAICLRARFERAGDPADLDAAIDAGRRAVAAQPGHPEHTHLDVFLSNLANSLCDRFQQAGDRADIDAAVNAARQAVDAAPPDHPNLATQLSNLGNCLLERFQHAGGSGADIDAAIVAGQQSVAATPPGHAKLAMHLSNLANSFGARFEQSEDRADLDAAIDAARRAVAANPPGYDSLAHYRSNLGRSLLTRFKQAGDSRDLDAAIDSGRQSVAGTPPDHPGLARRLSQWGDSLFARFERAKDMTDLEAAIACWRQASQVATATPRDRLAAARAWGGAAADAGRAHEAAEGYATAVRLLPEVAWHGLERATREEQLAQWVGLAADAAACAVLDGCPELGVELLEQGRSVLWTQALNLRSDLTRLAEKAPDLAERLDRIRTILDTSVSDAAPPPSDPEGNGTSAVSHAGHQQNRADLRRRMAREWDDLLAQVRSFEEFEYFLEATPFADLAAAAVDGPVVIINASPHGCHALIVEVDSEHVRVVDLPKMSAAAAVEYADAMLAALTGAADQGREFRQRERDRRAILDVLDWLWDVIAEPVLGALGLVGPPEAGGGWPRVWWCPTGPLTVLPIHAAGRHPRLRTASSTTDSVLDRVISSYTPTLAALYRARQSSPRAPVRQLTVGMPATPGLSPLPAVRAELENLARLFPPDEINHQLVESEATRGEVLRAIAAHSWVHLACHASQQHADQARSGFALWDGTLTIADLATLPTEGRDLAFLSACQTAAGSVLHHHLDEAIHLAAAMQFLGYRHVIATMWTIADPPAPYVADAVYSTLTQGGRFDSGRASQALHQATCALRRTDPTNPLRWAPYIHLGI